MSRYLVVLWASLAVYAGALVISLKLLQSGVTDPALQIAIALLPVLGVGMAVFAIVGQIQRLDEMQRRVQLEALALAFVGTAVFTLTYGFLENVGFSKLPTFAIWPIMASLWLVGTLIGRLRYR